MMFTLADVLLFLVFGWVVGAIARVATPGRERGGWVLSMVLGIAGAFAGGFVGRATGIYSASQPAGFAMSILGAMVVVGIHRAFLTRRHAHV